MASELSALRRWRRACAANEAAPEATPNGYGLHSGLAVHGCGVWPVWTDRRSTGKEQTFTAPMATDCAFLTMPPALIGVSGGPDARALGDVAQRGR